MTRGYLVLVTIAICLLPMKLDAQQVTDEDMQSGNRFAEDAKKALMEQGGIDKNGCSPLTSPLYEDLIALSADETRKVLSLETARESKFLERERGTEADVVCHYYIDLAPAGECGLLVPAEPTLTGATDETAVEDYSANEGAWGGMIDKYEAVSSRVEQYPPLLKAAGKWSPQIEALHSRIENDLNKIEKIVESENSLERKNELLSPLFDDVARSSKKAADVAHVNFNWNEGCGAGDDDSQEVNFRITPKAKIARYILDYDFELCESLVSDPYDLNKCDKWQVMKPSGNLLSGSYRYQVVWDDGTSQRDTMKFDSYQEKAREFRIEK